MSILDTFYILFKTDADKAADEIEGVGKASDKTERSLLNTDAAVSRLGGSFVTIAAQLAAPIIAFASLGGALSLVFERVKAIDDVSDAASKLRSTTQDYEAFTRAVRASGGTLEDAQANLGKFSDKLNDAAARPDGPNAKNFAKWGIAFKDVKGEAVGAVDGLLALAKSLENVSQAEALGRLRRLGIEDADTIQFLMQGKQAIIEKMDAEKRAGLITEEQIEIVGDYQAAVGKTSNMLDSFANTLTGALLPAVTKGVELFNRLFGWLLDHRLLVEGFFIGVAGVVTAVFLPAMASAAAAVLAATWPFLLIGAAITAIGVAAALAYEDIMAYINGQNSLIGELVKKYQWLIDAVKDAWNQIVNAIFGAWEVIQPVLQAIADGAKSIIDAFVEIYQPLYDAFANVFSAIGELASAFMSRVIDDLGGRLVPQWVARFEEVRAAVADAFNDMAAKVQPFVDVVQKAAWVIKEIFVTLGEILKAIWGSTIGWMADKLNGIADTIRGLAGGVRIPVTIETPEQTAASPGGQIGSMLGPLRRNQGNGLGAQTPASLGAAANNNNVQNNVNVGDVNVDARGGDAKAIAAGVRNALQSELRNTAGQLDNGVDR